MSKRHQPQRITIQQAHSVHHKSRFNEWLAVAITRASSTMACAYVFFALSLIGLFGLLGWLNPFAFLLTTWVSQQCLQLVYLPILSVGQSVLGKHAEMQSEEQAHTVTQTYADTEEIKKRLTAIEMLLRERSKR